MFKFILCLGKKYEGLIENFFCLFFYSDSSSMYVVKTGAELNVMYTIFQVLPDT